LFDIWILKFGFTMKSKMKKLHKDQSGLTFVELLIVIAIAGFIAAAITGVLFQVLTINTRTSNRMTAVRQAQQAGFWVSPDVQMAQNVTPGGTKGFPLSLNWTDPATNYKHEVTYDITVDNELQRTHNITPQGGGATTEVFVVAEYIDRDRTSIVPNQSCSFPNCGAYTYNFTVTATVGAESETRTYEVKPRPGS
jgi:prepilin-type N-terminal cleavage/methylation domain-containing protein